MLKSNRIVTKRGRGRLCRLVLSGLLLAALVGGPSLTLRGPLLPAAQAAEPTATSTATASQLQLEGARLQLQGRPEEAIKKYRESLALEPNPKIEALIVQLQGQGTAKTTTAAPPAQQAQPAAPESAGSGPAKGTPPPPTAPAVADPVPAAPVPVAASQQAAPSAPTAAQSGTQPATPAVPAQASGNAASPPPVPAPAQAAAATAAQGPAKVPPAEPPQPIKRTPANAEEELIYAFTDWAIGLLPTPGPGQEVGLEVNRNYTITQVDGHAEVRLTPCTLVMENKKTLELGTVILRFQPQGKETLGVTMQLPTKAPLITAGKQVAELTIGSQELSALWNRPLAGFDRADLKLGDLGIQDSGKGGRLLIKDLDLHTLCSRDPQGAWDEQYRGGLKGLSVGDNEFEATIAAITGQGQLKGTNWTRYAELKPSLQARLKAKETLKLTELKTLLADLDQYLQLLASSTGTLTIEGINTNAKGQVFHLKDGKIESNLQRQEATGKIASSSKGEFQGLSFTEAQSPQKPQAIAATLESVVLTSEGSLHPIPAHLLADLFTATAGPEPLKEEAIDAYLSQHGVKYAKKILELIEGYQGEAKVTGLRVVNAQPNPVTLATAQFGAGFKTGNGEGGTIHTRVNFTDFKGMTAGADTIPQSANFSLEVKKIPSLLNLIPEATALAGDKIEQVQGQVTLNAINALMQSGMILTLTDSFIAFPAARISLTLLATVDQTAKYMSTGNLQLVMENPAELLRIAQGLSPDPQTAQALATVTALADRREENGKVVDRIEAKLDGQGKVLVNSKDLTAMFFPPPPPPQPQQAPQQQPAPKAKK